MCILHTHNLAKICTKMAYGRFTYIKSNFHVYASYIRGADFCVWSQNFLLFNMYAEVLKTYNAHTDQRKSVCALKKMCV